MTVIVGRDGAVHTNYFDACVAWSLTYRRVCGAPTWGEPCGSYTDIPLCLHHRRRLDKETDDRFYRLNSDFVDLIQQKERLALMLSKNLATVESTTLAPAPAEFGRSHTQWRSPIFHMVKAKSITTITQWDGETDVDEFVGWWCNGGTSSGATFVDEIPSDCELCQRCVEAVDFEQRRDEQRGTVDRTKYAQRTKQLLADIEGR